MYCNHTGDRTTHIQLDYHGTHVLGERYIGHNRCNLGTQQYRLSKGTLTWWSLLTFETVAIITYLVWLLLWWFLQCIKNMHKFAQCTEIENKNHKSVIYMSHNHNDKIGKLSSIWISSILLTIWDNYSANYILWNWPELIFQWKLLMHNFKNQIIKIIPIHT